MVDTKKEQEREELHRAIWAIADDLRGAVDGWDFKSYVLGTMFYRYISENIASYINQGEIDAGNPDFRYEDMSDAEAEQAREGLVQEKGFFILPSELFCNVRAKAASDENLNETLETVFRHIEESAKGSSSEGQFAGLFDDYDVNSNKLGATVAKRNEKLVKLLNGVADMNLGDVKEHDIDAFGDAYEYLMTMYASNAGKSGGEFFTPSQVSELGASLVKPQENDRIYDPTCGSGGLLLKAYKKVPSGKVAVYGQELNAQTWALCTMNMFLHGVDDARIWQGDTLSNPQNLEDDKLMKFQVVVANPPFSLDKWDSGFLAKASLDEKGKKQEKMTASLDEHHRFDWGVPPSSKGDYAFVLHMLNSLDAENGRMAVVLPHGVLFRGASEGKIRKQLVEMNLLDAVIGLPANLFYGTGIPACILVFKKGRTRDDVLFIDASGEGNYEKGKNQNLLRDSDIARIVSTYEAREAKVDKYSYRASRAEIRENDYNLNIPRYVDTFEEEELVDIDEVKRNIESIEAELSQVQAQMKKYLEELGL